MFYICFRVNRFIDFFISIEIYSDEVKTAVQCKTVHEQANLSEQDKFEYIRVIVPQNILRRKDEVSIESGIVANKRNSEDEQTAKINPISKRPTRANKRK